MKKGARHEARGARVLLAAAALALAACHEIPQDAAKPYAGKEDTKAYAGDRFNGDKAKFEKALADRAQNENEYIRTGDAGKKR
ncbi:MAG TPA: hypothetical protein VLL50_10515 [Usitatibacter sp.]|nr:hypothetical protein [Usitatibacter sp.]